MAFKQVNDFQREVIVLFKTWSLSKCKQFLPEFFKNILQDQFSYVASKLKNENVDSARKRKHGSGSTRKFGSPVRAAVVQLALTPTRSSSSKRRFHLSQRQIASELNLSKGTVFNILNDSSLKCYRRIKTNKLTEAHKGARKMKSRQLLERFHSDESWKSVWFSDESSISISPSLNTQNERVYRAVEVKTEIDEKDLLIETDRNAPSVMCYAAVSWYGKTDLRFIEGYADGQDNVIASKRKKKTINQKVYREEMCPRMFNDINDVLIGLPWTWQQDGAKPHTALETVAWLRRHTPDFIEPTDWPSKSPDLNVMDYCIWSILLKEVQSQHSQINSIDDLKFVLTEAWNSIDQVTIQRATTAWQKRLQRCYNSDGSHFEHLL